MVFYGKGAGKLPTASAVVADIIDCMKASGTIGSLRWNDDGVNIVEEHDNTETQAYLRVQGIDEQDIKDVFGTVRMLSRKDQPKDERAFVTEKMTEGEMTDKKRNLTERGGKILSHIRLLNPEE